MKNTQTHKKEIHYQNILNYIIDLKLRIVNLKPK